VPDDAPIEGCSDLGEFVGAQNVAVDVDLTASQTDLATGEVGLPYDDLALLVGGLPPYAVAVTDGTVPDGLSVHATTGVLSGIPAADGAFSFTLDAEDSTTDTVHETFSITIVPAVAVDTGELPVAVAGECYFATVAATGGVPPYEWTEIKRDLPNWADTDNDNDVSGCPDASDEGVTPITFEVKDSLGAKSSKTLDLVVVVAATETPSTETPLPTATPTPTATVTVTPTAPPVCIGNCNGDAAVSIDELVVMVGITLDRISQSACAEGLPAGASMDISLVVQAVRNALATCTLP
jgi:hypothetical protein